MQESLQSVFLDVFSLPDHNSKLYFFTKGLVQALGNLSTFAVQHYRSGQAGRGQSRELLCKRKVASKEALFTDQNKWQKEESQRIWEQKMKTNGQDSRMWGAECVTMPAGGSGAAPWSCAGWTQCRCQSGCHAPAWNGEGDRDGMQWGLLCSSMSHSNWVSADTSRVGTAKGCTVLVCALGCAWSPLAFSQGSPFWSSLVIGMGSWVNMHGHTVLSPELGHIYKEYSLQKQCLVNTCRQAKTMWHCPRDSAPMTRSDGMDKSRMGIMSWVHL